MYWIHRSRLLAMSNPPDWRHALPALACAGAFALMSLDLGAGPAARATGEAGAGAPAGGAGGVAKALAAAAGEACEAPAWEPTFSSSDDLACTTRGEIFTTLIPIAMAVDMGQVVETMPTDPGCPYGMARMGYFCVDRYEAHLVSEGISGFSPWPHNKRPEPGTRFEARSTPGVHPQAYISRVEAEDACKNAGKRLCSMVEWQRACDGKRGAGYPYGPRYEAGRCNSGKTHLLTSFFGPNARGWKYDEHFNNPILNTLPGFLARTGAFEACTSDERVYDMVGNLHEWVSDTVTEALVTHLESEDVKRRKQPFRVGNGVFLGGFFSTTGEHGPGCKFVTIAHEPAYHDYSAGFRCCANARGESAPPKVRGGPTADRGTRDRATDTL